MMGFRGEAIPIPLSKLEPAVCSEAEADTRVAAEAAARVVAIAAEATARAAAIATHKENVNAHHIISRVTYGSYVGDNAPSRAIAHGLGIDCLCALIIGVSGVNVSHGMIIKGSQVSFQGTCVGVTEADNLNFFVADQANSNLNTLDRTYKWVAIG